MTGNADISLASDRLDQAISGLENSMSKMIARLEQLEHDKSSAQSYRDEAESFKEDRVKLAQKLDESAAEIESLKTRDAEFQKKEQEFNALAKETAIELEQVIGQVKHALKTSGSGAE